MATTPLIIPVTKPVVGFTVAIAVFAELQVPPGVEDVKVVDEPTQTFIPANTVVGGFVTVIVLVTEMAHGNNIGSGVKT